MHPLLALGDLVKHSFRRSLGVIIGRTMKADGSLLYYVLISDVSRECTAVYDYSPEFLERLAR